MLESKSKHEPGVGAPQLPYERVKRSMLLPGKPRCRRLSTHRKAHSGHCINSWNTGQAELQSETKTVTLKVAQECTHNLQSYFCGDIAYVRFKLTCLQKHSPNPIVS